jgi:hypothetical protein
MIHQGFLSLVATQPGRIRAVLAHSPADSVTFSRNFNEITNSFTESSPAYFPSGILFIASTKDH